MLLVREHLFIFLFKGFFMVKPINSSCCNPLRTRSERTTLRRTGVPLTGEKESKLTTIKINMKNDNFQQHDVAVECQL